MRLLPLLIVLGGCAVEAATTTCDALCDELVGTCAYAAYPTRDDCMQGCTYYETEGVDVDAYQACVADAACGTFAIVECEHAHGIDAE